MHIFQHAQSTPNKAALIMAETGLEVSYGDLEARSNQLAHLFRSLGAGQGDCIAVMLPNEPLFFACAWAAQRAGLYFTALSTHLTPDEALYIAEDSAARVIICADEYVHSAKAIAEVAQDIRVRTQ
ncbi:AMP-binding protein [Sphingomonas sp. ID0503]|uniref:AMP-binding protein n=1 Tax=Sphingomonas sp. ID0503 TaxID=3399691 RepID=UPI003AFA554F